MSSENYVRIMMVENLRFLGEGSSALGKSEAKARPRGVVDAHTVEIPEPPKLKHEGHLKLAEPGRWLPRAKGSSNERSPRCEEARKGLCIS